MFRNYLKHRQTKLSNLLFFLILLILSTKYFRKVTYLIYILYTLVFLVKIIFNISFINFGKVSSNITLGDKFSSSVVVKSFYYTNKATELTHLCEKQTTTYLVRYTND